MTEPSTPSGRQVIVVRAGPPKKKGHIVDAIAGILGVALLVMAGVLGEVLPEEEFIPTQFRPEYPSTNHETTFALDDALLAETGAFSPFPGSISNFYLEEGETVDFPVLVEHDNVYSFQVRVFIENDDIASSFEDRFVIQIKDRDGNVLDNLEGWDVKTGKVLARDPTQIDPDNPASGTDPLYATEEVETVNTFRFGAAPEPEFISGKDGKDIDRVTALRYAVENGTMETEGLWFVSVTLIDAGDCPSTSGVPTPASSQRAAECARATSTSPPGNNPQPGGSDGQDVGNAITLRGIRYDYYTIEVPEPAE